MAQLVLLKKRTTLAIALATAMLGSAGARADDADHEALRALREVYERAVNENNVELLRPCLDPDFSAVTSTNQVVSGYDAFRASWQEYWGRVPVGEGGPRYTARLQPSVSLVYGDLAVGGGTSNDTIKTADGREYPLVARWTVVFRKQAGTWKILRLHASLDPFGNPFVVREVRRVALQAAIAALLAGVLLGWLGRWAWDRRRRVSSARAIT